MRRKVVLVTSRSGFPEGHGAASMLRKLSLGFSQLGYGCEVLLLSPSEPQQGVALNDRNSGYYRGAYFEYMTKQVRTHQSAILRLWRYCAGLIRLGVRFIKNRHLYSKVVIYSPDQFVATLVVQSLCRLIRVSCVGIKTESSYCDSQRLRRSWWAAVEPYLYRQLDEMFVISEHLVAQLRGFGFDGKIAVFPILVDEKMFDSVDLRYKKRTLAYLGTLGYWHELNLLIHAYLLVRLRHPEWHLTIAGAFPDSKTESRVRLLVSQLGVAECVYFVGHLKNEEVPVFLGSAGVLVLPRLDEEYARAGFPIKLGEYLLSGSPVVSTAVGEIGKYLRDGETAFLVESSDPASFASKIVSVIDNYDYALQVGERGRQLAREVFSIKKVCSSIVGN